MQQSIDRADGKSSRGWPRAFVIEPNVDTAPAAAVRVRREVLGHELDAPIRDLAAFTNAAGAGVMCTTQKGPGLQGLRRWAIVDSNHGPPPYQGGEEPVEQS
jgi:hypothetical protein